MYVYDTYINIFYIGEPEHKENGLSIHNRIEW